MMARCLEIFCLLATLLIQVSSNDSRQELLMQRRRRNRRALKEKQIPDDMHEMYGDINSRRNNRKLVEQGIEDEDEDFSRVITVECSETPAFLCEEEGTTCIERVRQQQDQVIAEIQATIPTARVVARAQKLVNAVYIDLPPGSDKEVRSLNGVKSTMAHHTYEISLEEVAQQVGAQAAHEEFCATGKGVKVAVLDSGIDYTHQLMGGSGSPVEYAYAYTRPANRDRFFPTERVVDGYDFIGTLSGTIAVPDIDPIDEPRGHGTAVASAVLAVAPDASLVAVRVCSGRLCPEFALTRGLEYAMDPNGDADIEDKVDIINMSLGSRYLASFHDSKSLAIERAFELGTLTVIAAGNWRNRPYVMGPIASSPNGMAVAATGHPSGDPGFRETIEAYSSRGPGENNAIKPDISAPSGSRVAVASTGIEMVAMRGTSFSAPVVAGAAAVLKERCPSCSPLALKAILMNNAFRSISYGETTNRTAPVTLGGTGELRIRESLNANFWAYSPDEGDVQPSLSLGLVNAASDITISRSIKIVSLLDSLNVLDVSAVFRDPDDAASGAVTVSMFPRRVALSGCNDETRIVIDFKIDASKAPTNHMGVGGDPSLRYSDALDANEFDGHIIVQSVSTGHEITLPFHVLLRKAANTTISTGNLPWEPGVTSTTEVAVQNFGAGVAQLEAFDLVALSRDESERNRGEKAKGDIRAVGFRALEVGDVGCPFIFEFLVNTWERHELLNPKSVMIGIRTTASGGAQYYVVNDFEGRSDVKVIVGDLFSGERTCTGFPPDDSSNSRNTILRVCSADVGSPDEFFITAIVSIDAPMSLSGADFVDSSLIRVNQPSFSAPSYDVPPGATLGLKVSGSGFSPQTNEAPLGLLLMTNGFRSDGNTGAATADTETHILLVDESRSFPEITPDLNKEFPSANDTTGPDCLWQEEACQTPTASPVTAPPVFLPPISPIPPTPATPPPTIPPTCVPNPFPRHELASWEPTNVPTTSIAPSLSLVPSTSTSSSPMSSQPSSPPSDADTSSSPSPSAASCVSFFSAPTALILLLLSL